jgi:hypothetical protein
MYTPAFALAAMNEVSLWGYRSIAENCGPYNENMYAVPAVSITTDAEI